MAGRWFRSKSLESGPWEFVDGKSLPEGFAKIPENSPKAGVLASVPGTGPAKEALIANAIPQTATITRNEAQLQVKYDGDPQFKKIEGTDLQYAVNTATPVIRVDDKNYYAVENAVWFVGLAPVGPWAVATSVPASDLLDSSQFLSALRHICQGVPLHAGCRLRWLHARVLRHGGVFHDLYGCVRHRLVLSALYRQLLVWSTLHLRSWRGLHVEFGNGLEHHDRCRLYATAILTTIHGGGPWGYYGACCWGPAWGYGYGGYASANVYGRWGNAAYAGTGAAWANPYTGNYGGASRADFSKHTTRYCRAWRGAAPIPTSTPATPSRGVGPWATTRTTGIVAGGGAGYAGNMYSGQGAAGRGGFAYNTNTGAGVAAGF